ncbi:MAG: DNA polymerase III subunit gamma/tau [Patescibacteria group bacterium]|nr:DNA polymerase III subunit gamma/tau [Patescibacteria group bacterium]
MALYQKYRPQIFSEIEGQEHIKNVIQAALLKNMASHAYIFTGPRGTGKTTVARILAKALMCDKPAKTGDPCLKCRHCLEIVDGRAMDLIEMDAASHTGVDDIRELIEKSQFAPVSAKKKIYIIDEVHMLSRSAFNALLKTLEEPPAHLHFILATTEIDKVPETILSRCQRFDFHRVKASDIVKKLETVCKGEKLKCKKTVLEMIAERADGAVRNGEVLLEQLMSENALDEESAAQSLGIIGTAAVNKFMELLGGKKWKELAEYIAELHNFGQNLKTLTREVLKRLQNNLLEQLNEPEKLGYTAKLITIFLKASDQFKSSLVAELPLEMAIAEIALLDNSEIQSNNAQKYSHTKQAVNKSNDEICMAKPQPKATEFSGHIDDTFKKLWVEVLNSSSLAVSLRNSLKTAIPREFLDGNLTMVLHSEFHFDKVSKPDISIMIEKEIENVFKKKFTINWISEPQVSNSETEQISHSFTPLLPSKTPVENAHEIFG